MIATINSMIVIFAALFPVINPPGTSMLFYAMTRHATRGERAELAKRVALYAFLIINVSLYVGAFLLQVFGVSVPVLRVAGGIVVTLTGWKLLNAGDDEREDIEKPGRGRDLTKSAFYPLTMPLTAGPGTIAVTIALGASRPKGTVFFGSFVLGALLATTLITAMIYICYRYADRVERALGETASDAMVRLFAFILMCIGIEILWGGLYDLLASLPRR